MGYFSWEIYARVFMGFMLISAISPSHGFTDPRDVIAVNNLYAALGYPPLPGWVPNGGDPCLEAWQGVQCVNSNITGIILNAANLGGQLGTALDFFSSIITIDLSNNRIGGSIPPNLPPTVTNFFLQENQLVGSIPGSIASLSQLTDLSLNNNLLTGDIPDGFLTLTSLVNLNLFDNNLTGQLPPSMGNLSSLTTLHLQNNQLTGTLNVLQDLPLRDLNIENNLFSGPIPVKLLSIPNFKKDGNPFNTTIAPSSPSFSPPPSPGAPGSTGAPLIPANGPSQSSRSHSTGTKKFWTTKKFIWVALAAVLILMILALVIALCMSSCCKRRRESDRIAKRPGAYKGPRENKAVIGPTNETRRVPREDAVGLKDEHGIDIRRMGAISRPDDKQEIYRTRMGPLSTEKEEHEIDMTEEDMDFMPPPPPPPFLAEKVIVKPKVNVDVSTCVPASKSLELPASLRSFTIASLQQYTNSFSQENLIGRGTLGSVYRAELPDGKLLAIKKLDNLVSIRHDDKFLELVSSIYKLRHANVVGLVGYCAEHAQRLLIYDYCSNGTLHDALHSGEDLNRRLSWSTRIRICLGAARALEYLHEVCQPPVVHGNFKSANILLDDEILVRLSDCGLAPLISSSQLSGQLSVYGYGAPESELGAYTTQSDVYSLGVVMLELLTGRKSYDRSRPRGEQFLVRWAIPQLHDFDALSRMVDTSLKEDYPAKSLSRFADIISLCVQSEPEFRPPMSEIVESLLHMIQREPVNKRPNED